MPQNTKAEKAAYMYKHRRDISGHACSCGGRAVRYNHGWVCANCDRIESLMYKGHGARHAAYDFAFAGQYNPDHKYAEVFGF